MNIELVTEANYRGFPYNFKITVNIVVLREFVSYNNTAGI